MSSLILATLFFVPCAAAQEKTSPAVEVSTASVRGPELKRRMNASLAELMKKQKAETEALRGTFRDPGSAEARRALEALREAHRRQTDAAERERGYIPGARPPAGKKNAAGKKTERPGAVASTAPLTSQ